MGWDGKAVAGGVNDLYCFLNVCHPEITALFCIGLVLMLWRKKERKRKKGGGGGGGALTSKNGGERRRNIFGSALLENTKARFEGKVADSVPGKSTA